MAPGEAASSHKASIIFAILLPIPAPSHSTRLKKVKVLTSRLRHPDMAHNYPCFPVRPMLTIKSIFI
jgi:hypothetical protein